MRYGIRELKDGGLSRAVRRASQGEEIVVTDHGRPVAKIVPYDVPTLSGVVAELVANGKLQLRIPMLSEVAPVPMSKGAKTAVDYIVEQRR
jgi:prevent-host-death family protein